MAAQLRISIPKDQITNLDTVVFNGNITVIDRLEQVDDALKEICQHKLVGFDTETRPSFTRGKSNKVALMQISTDDRAWLFRLNQIGMPDKLKDFIENPDILKIGLSIRDDFFVMHRSSEFDPQGFVELQSMVRDYSIIDSSLQRIYAILFSKRISKSQRLSNWEAKALSPAQQSYAAIDAWACLKIYRHLLSGDFIPENSPFILPEPTPDAPQIP